MRYQRAQLIELLLSPSLPISDLQAQLEHRAGAESAKVRIANRMEATLTGSGFAIRALTPELQAITSEQTSHWAWEVTPTEHGSRSLHVALAAEIHVEAATCLLSFEPSIGRLTWKSPSLNGYPASFRIIGSGCGQLFWCRLLDTF